ncbi:MAG: DUF59 domain-containing protein [Paludibacteraceae bacterium]|jgi:FeS assembly SUF system protein|nr:DUF59 domain-containing protein [Paludibacteraceae bacterium]MBO7724730.1 DUF59 domain-containing protein [Paludibacteraceae bacterium]
MDSFLTLETKIVEMLRTVFDPEIPVNVYDLGLIYKIEVSDNKNVTIDMTLTAPNCPAADFIVEDVKMKVESVENIGKVEINLVFEPEWDKEMMSEEAKLELGLL